MNGFYEIIALLEFVRSIKLQINADELRLDDALDGSIFCCFGVSMMKGEGF